MSQSIRRTAHRRRTVGLDRPRTSYGDQYVDDSDTH